MEVRAKEIPDAELAVLRVLWDRGASTIRQLTEVLYPHGSDAHYATVQKLLDRLEVKGCVRRDTSARAHTFRAAIERDELIGRRLQAVAEKLCDGSTTPLLTHLVRAKRLNMKEWQELVALIDELAPAHRNRPGRRQHSEESK
jgi:BlaI family transcriptional regulator, penicillinase repressor